MQTNKQWLRISIVIFCKFSNCTLNFDLTYLYLYYVKKISSSTNYVIRNYNNFQNIFISNYTSNYN